MVFTWAITNCAAVLIVAPGAVALAIGLRAQATSGWGSLLRASLLALCLGGICLTVGSLIDVAKSHELFIL